MPSKVKEIRSKKPGARVSESIVVKDRESIKTSRVVRGRVVGSKTAQTAKVVVEWKKIHPLFKKGFMQSKKYLVHTEIAVKDGDIVDIMKIRPISKNKHWQIVKVLGQDLVAVVTKQLKEEAAEAIAEVMPEKETQSSEVSTPVVIEPEAKDSKPKSENRKQKTDNRRSK